MRSFFLITRNFKLVRFGYFGFKSSHVSMNRLEPIIYIQITIHILTTISVNSPGHRVHDILDVTI